jgi:uncharacterized protein (DUF58 family)
MAAHSGLAQGRLDLPAAPPNAGARLVAAIDRVAARLARRRGPVAGDVRLTQRSIYILPTKAGLLYGGVLLSMLVAAINYQLSLGYALTFLLGGIAIVAILHTFRNLTQVVLRPGRCEPVFAGQLAEFSLTIVNPTRIERFALRLIAPGMAQEVEADLPPTAEQIVSIALPTTRRGWMPAPRLRVWTRYPVGLWRAWGYWHPAMRVLVYPTPETPPVPLPETLARSSEGEGSGQGEEDVAALRPYRPGDPLRRIAWKAIARSGSDTLLSKDFDGGARGERLLDWHALPTHLDVEARISRLARWVIDAEASGGKWSLQLPGEQIEPDGGPGHRQRCLEALALMDV